MTNEATRSQNEAADPVHSVWLGANAGSGKTRVLTNRVARLLLAGVDPQNILCLTYTKAAASEMQNRLFQTLGSWAMLDEAALRSELTSLGEVPPKDLAGARTLFAGAIETPGGLKIQTIHAFCASVLRRFPLEAGVSPQFREMDERGQQALMEETLDTLARDPAVQSAALIYSGNTLASLAQSVVKRRTEFRTKVDRADIYARLGSNPNQTELAFLEPFRDGDLAFLADVVPLLDSNSALAQNLDGLGEPLTYSKVLKIENALVSVSTGNPKTGTPSKKFMSDHPDVDWNCFKRIAKDLAEQRPQRLAFENARRTAALHDFADAFLPAYEAAKANRGVLDFDDLIERTQFLLSDRSLDWVLYKLDGQIEHILVDEAQDTSPAQWSVIEALSKEIMSGKGASERPRTIFVVGDKKQSIYSFQGADARAFDAMEQTFRKNMAGHDVGLKSSELRHSFRSSPAILRAVDATFDSNNSGLGQVAPRHIAFHEHIPGRVDLWPLVPPPEKEEDVPWHTPVDKPAPNAPSVVLGREIAAFVKDRLEKGSIPGKDGTPRRIRPDDFLILVQSRGKIFDQIIRHCKALDLPMAGSDRLKVGSELAVRDLVALLSFLSLPDDDLSLAAALRSPIFGWSEQDLFSLAARRGGQRVWQALRARGGETADTLSALLNKVDFLRPFELLEHILIALDGRRKLVGRLGPEARDGIDELLNQALRYEQDEVPSLSGFVAFAQSDDNEIKRTVDQGAGMIRVMTVHGSKGLEAPIVLLPDTMPGTKPEEDKVVVGTDGTPLWRVRKEDATDPVQEATAAESEARTLEYQRLLYVAMTRAERWLVVCGVTNSRSKKTDWHADVAAGLENLNTMTIDTPLGRGLRLQHEAWPDDEPAIDVGKSQQVAGNIPDVLQRDAQVSPTIVAPVAPSDLGGAKTVGGGEANEDAMQRGRQIHALLEHLADAAPQDRHQMSETLLSYGPDAVDGMAEREALLSEAVKVLDTHPTLFKGALAEVGVTAFLPSLNKPMQGIIDRLIVSDQTVTAIDFKSNRTVPTTPDTTPEGVLRQLGAYLEALEQIWPDRTIVLEILWTATAQRMVIPHGIVREALARAPTS